MAAALLLGIVNALGRPLAFLLTLPVTAQHESNHRSQDSEATGVPQAATRSGTLDQEAPGKLNGVGNVVPRALTKATEASRCTRLMP